MKPHWIAAAILLLWSIAARAHRTDEYLQAALLSLQKDRVNLQLRLTPGIAIFPVVLAAIDADSDGVLSDVERNTYAQRVLSDLSLTVDGGTVLLQLDAANFANVEDMRAGVGEIQLDLHAELPRGGPNRKLVFKNGHRSSIAAYLVNALAPRDTGIRITAQTRSENQSIYDLDYVQEASASWWSGERLFMAAAVLLLIARLAWSGARNRASPT